MGFLSSIGKAFKKVVSPVTRFLGGSSLGSTLTSGLLTGGLSLGSSLLSNKLAKGATDSSRGWQEEMANTAYQRSMLDMKAAGLNPILAYKQGGAGVGSSGPAATTPINSDKVVQNAMTQKRLVQELQNMRAIKTQTDMVTGRTKAETATQRSLTQKNQQDAVTSHAQQQLIEQQRTMLSIQEEPARILADIDVSKSGQRAAHISKWTKAIGNALPGLFLGGSIRRGRGKPMVPAKPIRNKSEYWKRHNH